MSKATVELRPSSSSVQRNGYQTVLLIDGKEVAQFGFVEQVNDVETSGMHSRLVKAGPMPEPDPLAVEVARLLNAAEHAARLYYEGEGYQFNRRPNGEYAAGCIGWSVPPMPLIDAILAAAEHARGGEGEK